MGKMKQVEDFYYHEKKINLVFKKQDILRENIKKLEKLCNKKYHIDYSIREFCYAYEFFINNKYANSDISRDFNKQIKNFLSKFKRCELINTIFSYNNLIKKILNEVQNFYDPDSSIKSLDPKFIYIKPLINFQKDSMKLRFIIKEELEKNTKISEKNSESEKNSNKTEEPS